MTANKSSVSQFPAWDLQWYDFLKNGLIKGIQYNTKWLPVIVENQIVIQIIASRPTWK